MATTSTSSHPSPEAPVRVRGRRPASLCDRVQSGVWYCGVRRDSKKNDCRLDCCYLIELGSKQKVSSAARPRVFERIRRSQRSPDHDRYLDPLSELDDRSFNLVDRVESHCSGTASRYRSFLWELLGPSPPDLAETQKNIELLLRQQGRRRLGFLASWTFVNMVKVDHPQHPLEMNSRLFSAMAKKAASVDTLALLCALAHEAVLMQSFKPAYERLANVAQAAKAFVASKQLRFIPGLSDQFLKLFKNFENSFSPLANAPHGVEFTPYSTVLIDNEASRNVEAELETLGRSSIGPWLEQVLAKLQP